MTAILPTLNIDSQSHLLRHFTPYQVNWILSDEMIHANNKQAFALAEKSVRIGWTYADGLKNVRKRLKYPKRDYLFATRDHASAIEYMHTTYTHCEIYDYTRSVVSHGEELLKIPRLDKHGQPTGFTEEMKVGMIKFENGSRIIAFSSNPQAMAVYGGDVGLDEFAKHNNAQLLWETAQGRVTWGFDIAIWSAHNGDDTLFYTFAQEARAGLPPWNLYYRVTMPDAIELGLLKLINKVRHTNLTPDQFLADCRARSHQEEIFQQAYLCNPAPAAAGLVDWPTIERCRLDYTIERAHLETADVVQLFGDFLPSAAAHRQSAIQSWLRHKFSKLLASHHSHRLGFDVAASGEGDLAAFYIDSVNGTELHLQALLTCRTEDWQFIKTALLFFLGTVPSIQGAGDASGLGRQICWEAANQFPGRFNPINFSSRKNELALSLMNQLALAQKRFPRAEPDIASDFLAIRKKFSGQRWTFSESRNLQNPASHCDIAWAAALATDSHLTHSTGLVAYLA